MKNRKIQITKIRNKRKDITTDLIQIKKDKGVL